MCRNIKTLADSEVAQRLLDSLTTAAPPRNRAAEARKRRERARKRFG
jgi:hypothetical protein